MTSSWIDRWDLDRFAKKEKKRKKGSLNMVRSKERDKVVIVVYIYGKNNREPIIAEQKRDRRKGSNYTELGKEKIELFGCHLLTITMFV